VRGDGEGEKIAPVTVAVASEASNATQTVSPPAAPPTTLLTTAAIARNARH
jgi:hypothetical protein